MKQNKNYKYKWKFDFWKWGIELNKLYSSPMNPSRWNPTQTYYVISLTKSWRLSDLGYEEVYYDGIWYSYAIPFVMFSWGK